MELQPIAHPPQAVTPLSKLGELAKDATPNDTTPTDSPQVESVTPPPEAIDSLPRWNHPSINKYRLAAIFFAFVNFGMSDASYGPLLPYIQSDYDLNYTVASLVFLTPFAGYMLAAFISDRLHMWAGRRGMAAFAPLSRLLGFVVISTHPSFPVVATFYAFVGFGNGMLDGSWNAWAGEMDKSTQIMGILHGFYGLGAVIAPAIGSAMVTKYGCGWWQFYYLMIGVVALEAVLCVWAFWDQDAATYQRVTRTGSDHTEKGMTRRAIKRRTTWVTAVFLFLYMGVEVSTGGYIVIFMTDVRHGEPFPSGLSATGFWLGLTVGRVVLGFVTPKIGERRSVIIYIILALGVELLFWLVPQFIVSAIAIALVGFFIGPFFPAAVLMAARLLPKELHVASIGFASALGGGGAAILPFVVGAIVESSGVKMLQPIILSVLVAMLVLWFCYPKMPKHAHQR